MNDELQEKYEKIVAQRDKLQSELNIIRKHKVLNLETQIKQSKKIKRLEAENNRQRAEIEKLKAEIAAGSTKFFKR